MRKVVLGIDDTGNIKIEATWPVTQGDLVLILERAKLGVVSQPSAPQPAQPSILLARGNLPPANGH